jgi:hypothetical protein
MKFVLPRDRTIASTCGLSIEFKKNVLTLVPPAMYQEVIAAGGVPEHELSEDELPKSKAAPEVVAEREKQLNDAFALLVDANDSTDFTAGGTPALPALSRVLGWTPTAKERDQAWVKFLADKD